MTLGGRQCIACKHLRGTGCLAFPQQIPLEILQGKFDHTKPYHGDHGIRFELLEGAEL